MKDMQELICQKPQGMKQATANRIIEDRAVDHPANNT